MRAIQHVVRLLVVIECPQCPAIRVVTVTAPGPEALAVLVVTSVTIRARQGCVFIGGRNVTLFAGDHGVQADEGEGRQVMVKEYFCTPSLFVVALVAFLPLLSFVDVVILMAAIAISFQLRSALLSRVAAVACHFFVGATQSEFCILVMIESDLVPAGFAMTIRTFCAECPLVFVVEFVAGVTGGLELVVEDMPGMTGFA